MTHTELRGDCADKSSKATAKFPHHMIREIYEQPDAVRRVLTDHIDGDGKIRLPQLPFTSDQIRSFSKITIATSGSSRHAGMVGEFMFERMAAIDVKSTSPANIAIATRWLRLRN